MQNILNMLEIFEIVKDLLGPIARVVDVIKDKNAVLKVQTILF
jgi:hypothetical protein